MDGSGGSSDSVGGGGGSGSVVVVSVVLMVVVCDGHVLMMFLDVSSYVTFPTQYVRKCNK